MFREGHRSIFRVPPPIGRLWSGGRNGKAPRPRWRPEGLELQKWELSAVPGWPEAAEMTTPGGHERESGDHRGCSVRRAGGERGSRTDGVDQALRRDPGGDATLKCEAANR